MFRRSCNITAINVQKSGTSEVWCVATKRCQSSWLSFPVCSCFSLDYSRGVLCMTRVLDDAFCRPHRSQHGLQKSGSNKLAKCMPSYRTRLPQVPKNAHNKTTRHKKRVYQIVTPKKPNGINSAANPASHIIMKKRRCKEIVKGNLVSGSVPWFPYQASDRMRPQRVVQTLEVIANAVGIAP